MSEKVCLDCKKKISHKAKQAKRCMQCSHKHQLSLMKKYRKSHKKEIREYQKIYYGKNENHS